MRSQVVVSTALLLCVAFIGPAMSVQSILDVFRSPEQEAVGPMQESCAQLADEGNCQFYVCFEQRHPCESNNYALDYGWRFCSLYDTHRDRLTPAAQQWLNNSRVCAMQQMTNIYRRSSVRCGEVASHMKDAQAACEVEHGLCSANLLTENRQVFSDVYTRNRRSVSNFIHAIKHCTLSKFREVSSWFREHVGHSRVAPALRQLRDQVRGHVDELRDHVHELRDDVIDEARRFRSLFTNHNNDSPVHQSADSDDDIVP